MVAEAQSWLMSAEKILDKHYKLYWMKFYCQEEYCQKNWTLWSKNIFLHWNSYKTSIRTSTEIQRTMCAKLTISTRKQKGHIYIWKWDNTTKRNRKWCWYDQFLPTCYNSVCQVSYQYSLTGCKWASMFDTEFFWHRILMLLEGVILQPSFKKWEHQLLSSCHIPASQH